MIHPCTELRFIGANVGLGVFATSEIPRGTIVWALDPFDRRLAPEALEELPELLQGPVMRGSYIADNDELVFCWDYARYMNHSCAPNCVELGSSFELAIRTIAVGEELTCDYTGTGPVLPFACTCGARGCRGWVARGGAPIVDPAVAAASTLELLELAAATPQPLLDYACPDPEDRAMLRRLQLGRRGGLEVLQ